MLIKHRILLTEGVTEEVEGHRFSVEIDSKRFWFLVHTRVGRPAWTITELSTNKAMGITVPHSTLAAHKGEVPGAARATLKKWLMGRNEAQVRKIIEDAQALN